MNSILHFFKLACLIFLSYSNLYAQTWDELNVSFNKYYNNKEYGKAIDIAKMEIDKSEKEYGSNSRFYAISLFDLSLSYSFIGRFEESEEIAIRASNLIKLVSGEESGDYAESLKVLAFIFKQIGKYKELNHLYEESLRIFDKVIGKRHPKFIIYLNNLLASYIASGNYLKAEKLYYQNETLILNKSYDQNIYYDILNNLIQLYARTGRIDKAELNCTILLQNIEAKYGVNSNEYIQVLRTYADLMLAKKDYVKSELLYQNILKYFKTNDRNNQQKIDALYDLAQLYYFWGKYDKAEKYCKDVARKYLNLYGNENLTYGICISLLGVIEGLLGNYDEAENLLLEALPIYHDKLGYDHPIADNLLLSLGTLYSVKGDFKLAQHYFDLSNDNMTNQINKIFPVLSEIEKLNFLNKFDVHFTLYNSYCFKNYSYDANITIEQLSNSIANKNLILHSIIDSKNNLNNNYDSTTFNLLNKINSLKSILAKTLSLTNNNQTSIQNIENKIKDLEKQIALTNNSLDIDDTQYKSQWLNIKERLSLNTAAIDFIKFNYFNENWTDTTFYCALIVRKEYEYPQLVKLCTEKELEQFLSISADNNTSYLKSIESYNKLFNLIWKPLEQYLNGINIINISPCGLLNRVSFYALNSSENELLSDKYRIRYFTNLKDIVANKPEQKVNEITRFNASIFGGALFDIDSSIIISNSLKFNKDDITSRGSDLVTDDSVKISYSNNSDYFSSGKWKYLLGTKEEAENIRGLFDTHNIDATLYTGSDASEDALKSLNHLNSPTVLHISTHGYFFPEPPKDYNNMQIQLISSSNLFKVSDNPLFRSGLILAGANWVWSGNKQIENTEDGILTAYEVSNMDLTNTELVVLSACETGLGDIKGSEGVFGLQRAFKVAGANSILMSLWKVPDKETAELMNLFYSNWLSGKTKYESLHDAQLEMRKKYDPFYWAAFVLVE